MAVWLGLPLLLQAVVLFVDEIVFHRRRGLGAWERWGHPIDAASVFAAFCLPAFFEPSRSALATYIGLSAFSCLLVTKDEGVHTRLCGATEHWLHAVLFILHPVVFLSVGYAWVNGFCDFPRWAVWGQLVALVVFTTYQVAYWSARR